jgi:four helix bundle protein
MGIVEEEADESQGWIEMIADAGLVKKERVEELIKEAGELTAMTVASIKTARRNKAK